MKNFKSPIKLWSSTLDTVIARKEFGMQMQSLQDKEAVKDMKSLDEKEEVPIFLGTYTEVEMVPLSFKGGFDFEETKMGIETMCEEMAKKPFYDIGSPDDSKPTIEYIGVYGEVINERKKQESKWGEQNHPILDPILINRSAQRMCENYEIPSENRAKQLCEIRHSRGCGTYMEILVEEVSEAASCGKDTKALREELIQVAAVAVAMVESLDRNGR